MTEIEWILRVPLLHLGMRKGENSHRPNRDRLGEYFKGGRTAYKWLRSRNFTRPLGKPTGSAVAALTRRYLSGISQGIAGVKHSREF